MAQVAPVNGDPSSPVAATQSEMAQVAPVNEVPSSTKAATNEVPSSAKAATQSPPSTGRRGVSSRGLNSRVSSDIQASKPTDRSFLSLVSTVVSFGAFSYVCAALSGLYSMLTERYLRAEPNWLTEIHSALYNAKYPDEVIMLEITQIQRVKAILSDTPRFHAVNGLFLPLVLRFYLGKESFPSKALGLSFFAYWSVYMIGWGVLGIHLLRMSAVFYSTLFLSLALKKTLPKDSKIPFYLVNLVALSFVGTIFVLFLFPLFPKHTDVLELVFTCIVLPTARETMRYMAFSAAWYLSSDAEVGGTGLNDKIQRQYAWAFVAMIQTFWGTFYSLIVNNTKDPNMATFVIVYQAVLEVVLRLTIRYRDSKVDQHRETLRRTMSTRKKARKETKVFDIGSAFKLQSEALMRSFGSKKKRQNQKGVTNKKGMTNILRRSRSQYEIRRDARLSFYSMVLLIDMMCEYAGITNSLLIMLYWAKNPVYRPYDWCKDSLQNDQIIELTFCLRPL